MPEQGEIITRPWEFNPSHDVHLISLSLGLALIWLALSGHYTGLLLTLGGLSCALVVWLCQRMDIVGRQPVRWRRLPAYIVWLTREVLVSNWGVMRALLRTPPAQPVTATVPTPLRTDVLRAALGNAITLTPGTLTLDIHKDHMRVHALNPEFLDELLEGDMVKRAQELEA